MEVKNLFKLLSSLSNVKRYSTNHLTKSESVLEHTGSVCIVVAVLSCHLKSLGNSYLDIGDAMCKAALHDIEEAITGDVPRTTKYCSDAVRQGLQEYEEQTMMKMSDDLGLDGEIQYYWKSSKKSISGYCVRVADLLCVTYKMWVEVCEFNNYSVRDVVIESQVGYSKLINNINEEIVIRGVKATWKDPDPSQVIQVLEYLLSVTIEAYEIAKSIEQHLINRENCI